MISFNSIAIVHFDVPVFLLLFFFYFVFNEFLTVYVILLVYFLRFLFYFIELAVKFIHSFLYLFNPRSCCLVLFSSLFCSTKVCNEKERHGCLCKKEVFCFYCFVVCLKNTI